MIEDIEPLDDEIIEHLKAQTSQPRKHATFFTWHDRSAQGKGIAEAGIVDDLLTAMQAEGRTEYRSLGASGGQWPDVWLRSEEHTSELQSRLHLVCRLLLEKKKKQ